MTHSNVLGSRLEKTVKSLVTIGPAVFNGGVTTFLALLLCSGSTSHTFVTFFKVINKFLKDFNQLFYQVFVLTVIFGLYHGLVLLPVLLSICGPESKDAEDKTISSKIHNNMTVVPVNNCQV